MAEVTISKTDLLFYITTGPIHTRFVCINGFVVAHRFLIDVKYVLKHLDINTMNNKTMYIYFGFRK